MSQEFKPASEVSAPSEHILLQPDATEDGGSADGTGTDLAGYLHALIGSLDRSLGGRVVFKADLESCVLPFDKAVAAGLAANEPVANAAKHA